MDAIEQMEAALNSMDSSLPGAQLWASLRGIEIDVSLTHDHDDMESYAQSVVSMGRRGLVMSDPVVTGEDPRGLADVLREDFERAMGFVRAPQGGVR